MTIPKTYRSPEWWRNWRIKNLFNGHKFNADRRRIEFKFTFKEWVSWWEHHLGTDWMTLRGREPDQYCMCREGDKGPYAVWNVECKTNKQNRKEMVSRKGEGHHWVKLTEVEAVEILNSPLSHGVVAGQYGMSVSAVQLLRNGKTWRHLNRPKKKPWPTQRGPVPRKH